MLFNMDRWRIANNLREYIDAFEARMEKTGHSDDKDMKETLEWMKSKADFIDPLTNVKDGLLDESDLDKVINPKIIKTSESKPSYGYYNSEPQYSYWQIKNMWHK